jgi:hypothetical protein
MQDAGTMVNRADVLKRAGMVTVASVFAAAAAEAQPKIAEGDEPIHLSFGSGGAGPAFHLPYLKAHGHSAGGAAPCTSIPWLPMTGMILTQDPPTCQQQIPARWNLKASYMMTKPMLIGEDEEHFHGHKGQEIGPDPSGNGQIEFSFAPKDLSGAGSLYLLVFGP